MKRRTNLEKHQDRIYTKLNREKLVNRLEGTPRAWVPNTLAVIETPPGEVIVESGYKTVEPHDPYRIGFEIVRPEPDRLELMHQWTHEELAALQERFKETPHVDDWLDDPATAPDEVAAKEWMEHFRRPAHKKDETWLDARILTCEYQGKRYRAVGCSVMGDVWLTSKIQNPDGYEIRVLITECSKWERIDHLPQ